MMLSLRPMFPDVEAGDLGEDEALSLEDGGFTDDTLNFLGAGVDDAAAEVEDAGVSGSDSFGFDILDLIEEVGVVVEEDEVCIELFKLSFKFDNESDLSMFEESISSESTLVLVLEFTLFIFVSFEGTIPEEETMALGSFKSFLCSDSESGLSIITSVFSTPFSFISFLLFFVSNHFSVISGASSAVVDLLIVEGLERGKELPSPFFSPDCSFRLFSVTLTSAFSPEVVNLSGLLLSVGFFITVGGFFLTSGFAKPWPAKGFLESALPREGRALEDTGDWETFVSFAANDDKDGLVSLT